MRTNLASSEPNPKGNPNPDRSTVGGASVYLLDERHPYPYRPPERPVIERPGEKVTMEVTREEELFLRALRRCPARVRRLAFALPYTGLEQSWLLWKVAVAKRKLPNRS